MLFPHAIAVPTALCRWLTALARVLARILADDFPTPVWHLVIDDTLVPRTSRKAAGVGTHFDHSKKPNRPAPGKGADSRCWNGATRDAQAALGGQGLPFPAHSGRTQFYIALHTKNANASYN